MSESVVPALPDLDALRAKIDADCEHYSDVRVSIEHDVCGRCYTNVERIARALLDYAASLQRERDELRVRVPTPEEVQAMRAAYAALGGVRNRDSRLLRALVSRNTTTENEHGK